MKNIYKKMDKQLLFLMIVFTVFGLVMIFSASSITAVLYNKLEETYFFKKQLAVVIASWILCIILVLRIPTSKYKILAPIGIVVMDGILVFLLIYGQFVNSAKSWIDLGFFSLQPSEFLKPLLIVFLAVYMEKAITKKKFGLVNLLYPYIWVFGGIVCVILQPDLGTAIITAGISGLIFMFLPVKTKHVKYMKIGAIIFAILAFIFVFFSGEVLNSEQMDRLIYKNPCTRYTEKTGYQVCNGFIAISNGGVLGEGLGNSTQKYLYLPEAYTDFIFPIIIEELGIVGGTLILVGYLWLLYRLLKISKISNTIRGKIIAYGTFAYILLHILVNLMGVLALVPLTGVPLPFLSYGGSFYINLIFLLFLNQRIVIEKNESKTKEILRSL